VSEQLEAGSTELVKLSDGVFGYQQYDGSWWINNAGAVVGPDGVVLVDTCATRQRTERFLKAVDGATDGLPIRIAVNTHQHGDHTYGNALLPDTTLIVAHAQTREGLLEDFLLAETPPFWSPTPDWGITEVRLPTVVVRDDATLFAGRLRIELRHPGYPAHTSGDLVVWLPEPGALFAGDLLFHHITPMVLMGSLDGALRSLDWLAGFGADVVVPGHGPLIEGGDLSDVLAAHERYYRFVADAARRGIAAGLDPLTAANETDLGDFASWTDAERLVLNLHRGYADAAGTQVDVMAAFADTVTWHGGPLHCTV
jgi:cyclase